MYTMLNKFKDIIPTYSFQTVLTEKTLVINYSYLLFSLTVLKKHTSYQYKLLTCISGVDLLGSSYRFLVVYELLSLTYNARLKLKVFLNEITTLQSSISIFINSDWWEREIWDLYGIYFSNHPDLRRILTDYGFEGHPMRKDFPLSGYIELRYDESKKRVITESIQLAQEFRTFTLETPW
jgi:NADH dehydrogenase (ubiquinone) Fe-S protein 3